MITAFWRWYERSYRLQLRIAAVIFSLQLVHLVWLTTDVVLPRLFGTSTLLHAPWAQLFIVFVDYLEIPTLISVSLVYLNVLRKRFVGRDIAYLLLLNSQWIHIVWITHEFILTIFTVSSTSSTVAFAWFAIFIDYLEIPVIFDTLRRASFLHD